MDRDILVVEDDDSVSAVVSRVLQRLGVSVECVGTGGEAVARLETGGVGLIVMDLGLPDVDGEDLCRTVRANGFAGRILVLSARYGHDLDGLAMRAGADDFMAKPFTIHALETRARELLAP
ncbi:response regulator transcription factor [Nocardioides piscis]|uniref:Response regulator n=1 Tax=Nocardioides piscis TaxID=2714938 RepID=A0A6G7YGN4_9ACTN|nr:response regulator [Nocardioides piscis]QIK75798.1 response regulator [Nocardioides piscis]